MTRQLARFCVVGLSNTVLTFAAYALLTRAGVAAVAASAIAFLLGAANGYVHNRRWTFAVAHRRDVLARYAGVQLLGAGLSALGIAAARGDLALTRLAAEAVVVPFVTLVTFALARTVVFAG